MASTEPLYVVSTDARRNAVVVGPRASLARRRVKVRGRVAAGASRVEAKLRHRSPAVAATVLAARRGFELVLDEPFYGVAPGQTAVLYDDGAVVGSGVIVSSAVE